ncbi:MAG: KilA-N domain-containing protein [Bacteroidota bacterium]|nr:KilA-N domain-containing protein [Bacteroidota bacterium]
MNRLRKLDVNNALISITKVNEDDFICLTNMAKAKEGDKRAADIIKNWMRSRVIPFIKRNSMPTSTT